MPFSWIKKMFYKKNGELNISFYNSYVKNLNLISSNEYTEKFLDQNLKKIKEINSHIYSDYFFHDNITNYTTGLYYFLLSDFSHRAKIIQEKIATKENIHVTKKNNNQYLIRNSKNYGTVVVDKIICNKEDQKVVFKIDKPVNNFSNTIINLDLEQTRHKT